MTLVLSVQTTDKFTEAIAEAAAREGGEHFKSIDYDHLSGIVTVQENVEITGSPEVHALTPYLVHRAIERIVVHDTNDTVIGQLQRMTTSLARENRSDGMRAVIADAILQVACWGEKRY